MRIGCRVSYAIKRKHYSNRSIPDLIERKKIPPDREINLEELYVNEESWRL
jgi:hypothetical protein